ncbi:hypothetical protein AUR64_12355 [Haloprofundus marisrubri]|uniref:Ester cyclase n=1 Tax=Haloprofundus marisrubri TaxID=1514971 RepID=A0A0W1RCL7_9EURY|nr:ester cyclase [Haloprofundus marisrubri]KTG10355.1 hypothetical protein AUR64_12355 [Haloprofundus marisrubri]
METSSIEANKELVRRESAEILEKDNFDFLDEVYADDITVRMVRAGSEDPVVGRENIKTVYEEWKTAFPDLTAEINAEAAEGDVVMHHLTLRGTHEGPFRGVDPTGNEIQVNGFHLRRIHDGKIVETASMVEMSELLRQIGVDLPIEG